MKNRALRVKKGSLKHLFIMIYAFGVVLSCTIMVLITLFLSLFNNYKITIYTNMVGEAIPEIIFIATGFCMFLYVLIRWIKQPTT